MALTTSIVSRNVIGNQRLNVINVTFDDDYPTGGEAFSAAQAGMRAVLDAVVPLGGSPYTVSYDSPYLVAYGSNGVQQSDNADLSSLSLNVLAIGR